MSKIYMLLLLVLIGIVGYGTYSHFCCDETLLLRILLNLSVSVTRTVPAASCVAGFIDMILSVIKSEKI